MEISTVLSNPLNWSPNQLDRTYRFGFVFVSRLLLHGFGAIGSFSCLWSIFIFLFFFLTKMIYQNNCHCRGIVCNFYSVFFKTLANQFFWFHKRKLCCSPHMNVVPFDLQLWFCPLSATRIWFGLKHYEEIDAFTAGNSSHGPPCTYGATT